MNSRGGGEAHAYVRIGGDENVRNASVRGRGGSKSGFFAYVICGWPLGHKMRRAIIKIRVDSSG